MRLASARKGQIGTEMISSEMRQSQRPTETADQRLAAQSVVNGTRRMNHVQYVSILYRRRRVWLISPAPLSFLESKAERQRWQQGAPLLPDEYPWPNIIVEMTRGRD